jgi:hypothetical protein
MANSDARREHNRLWAATWRKAHPEEVRLRRRQQYDKVGEKDRMMLRNKATYVRLRAEIITAYGGECSCCCESEPVFLAIDHKYNDGAAERRYSPKSRGAGASFMMMIKREHFPPRYQLLCHNCNWAKYRGGCPHQAKKEVA